MVTPKQLTEILTQLEPQLMANVPAVQKAVNIEGMTNVLSSNPVSVASHQNMRMGPDQTPGGKSPVPQPRSLT